MNWPPETTREATWWREAVTYQIYPRSFQDTDGDGIGDLRGVIDRLDYLNDGTDRSLGVDAIWLSPLFASPMRDFGYDVTDHCAIDPVYGDLATFDRLIDEAHRRGIRVLLDYIPNHTSDLHPWFEDARSSRESSRRAWYIWRDPPGGGSPPNNWESVFGGAAWALEERTGQYYLHSYLREQPDLNWREPAVVEAMGDVLRFWLERGVDGVRLDAVGRIAKHPALPDNLPNPSYGQGTDGRRWLVDHNYLHPDGAELARAIRHVLDEFPGTVSIGEAYAPVEALARLYAPPALDGLHMMFDFHLIRRWTGAPLRAWSAETIAGAISEAERDLPAGAQLSWALGNHDVPRLRSRFEGDGRELERARAAALVLLALHGTPCIYYGDEIGMVDAPVSPAAVRDPVGRDAARSPMPWDRRLPGRGFTTRQAWLPFGRPDIDVASQLDDETSMLSLYRRAIRIRLAPPALRHGALSDLSAESEVVSWRRTAEEGRDVLVVVNTGTDERSVPLRGPEPHLLIASDDARVRHRGATSTLSLPSLAAAWLAVDAG